MYVATKWTFPLTCPFFLVPHKALYRLFIAHSTTKIDNWSLIKSGELSWSHSFHLIIIEDLHEHSFESSRIEDVSYWIGDQLGSLWINENEQIIATKKRNTTHVYLNSYFSRTKKPNCLLSIAVRIAKKSMTINKMPK